MHAQQMTNNRNENKESLMKKIILLLDEGKTKDEIIETIYLQEKNLLQTYFTRDLFLLLCYF